MNKYESHARAFNSLAGCSLEEANQQGFPETLTLPATIYRSGQAALTKTLADGRERTRFFRHRRGIGWYGGLQLRGPAPVITADGIKAPAHALARVRMALTTPHVFLHTHPTFTNEQLEEWVTSQLSPGETIPSSEMSEVERHLQAYVPVPSAGDVSSFTLNIATAHIIYAAGGIFTALRRRDFDPLDGLPFLQHPDRIQDAAAGAQRMRDTEAQINLTSSLEEQRKAGLAAAAQALEAHYVTYFSPDPAHPTPARITI